MNILTYLLIELLLLFPLPENFVPTTDLKAFTHPEFFYSKECECGMFNSKFFQLEVYTTCDTASHSQEIQYLIPSGFEVGYSVIIIGKRSDYFRIKFNEDQHPVCSQCADSCYYVKKGTLGTWLFNMNDSTGDFDSVPLFEKPSLSSKIITRVKPENSIAVILDVNEDWMLIETIADEKQKGWLCPQMQCGNPYGLDAGHCY